MSENVHDDLDENAARYDDIVAALEIGDGRLLYGFRLLVYLNAEGNEETGWKVDGIARAAHMVGHLEWAKLELVRQHIDEEDA